MSQRGKRRRSLSPPLIPKSLVSSSLEAALPFADSIRGRFQNACDGVGDGGSAQLRSQEYDLPNFCH